MYGQSPTNQQSSESFMAKQKNDYTDSLRRLKSQLLVSTLQRKKDMAAFNTVKRIRVAVDWSSRGQLMIDEDVWKYVTLNEVNDFFPKLRLKKPIRTAWENALYVWNS